MAHRKIGTLRSKFGISRSMNDLSHLFSDKSKSDSEINDSAIPEARSSFKYVKKLSLRQKRSSSKSRKQQGRDGQSIFHIESSEKENVNLPAITNWSESDNEVNDKYKKEHIKIRKQKTKEEKKYEKEREKNEGNSLSKPDDTCHMQQQPDEMDTAIERKISSLSWPSDSLVIQGLLRDLDCQPE